IGRPHHRLGVVTRGGVGGRRQAVDRAGAGRGADQLGGGGQGAAAAGHDDGRRGGRGQRGEGGQGRPAHHGLSSVSADAARSIASMRRSVVRSNISSGSGNMNGAASDASGNSAAGSSAYTRRIASRSLRTGSR